MPRSDPRGVPKRVVGRLDLLAQDSQGRFVVIELKVGKADDKVCGQVLRYMGRVKRNIAQGQDVRGIIVANDFTDRVRFAAEATSNVILKKYEIHFTLREE